MGTENDNGILLIKESIWYLCSGRTFAQCL